MAKDHSHHLTGPFGDDKFGKFAEKFARFLGTPKFIIGQTIIVICWVIGNGFLLSRSPFDPYPFILLNLLFSTQSAYAAPLILLAQTRQSDRDKAESIASASHIEEVSKMHTELLKVNTDLTEKVAQLTEEIHESVQNKVSSSQKGVE